MTAEETEQFTNLIYNDYRDDLLGLTKLLEETNSTIMKMEELRDQYGIVSVEAVMQTKARFEAMLKAWFLLHDRDR